MKPPASSRRHGPRPISWKGTPDYYAGRDSPSKRYDQSSPLLLWVVVASGVAMAMSLVLAGW